MELDWANYVTSISYFVITFCLCINVNRVELSQFFSMQNIEQKSNLICLIFAILFLFTSFIFLCGLNHLLLAIVHNLDHAPMCLYNFEVTVLNSNAIISAATAVVSLYLFQTLSKLNVLEQEKFQYVRNMELCQDSIVTMSLSWVMKSGNSASNRIFGRNFKGSNLLDYISNEDDLTQVRFALSKLFSTENEVNDIELQSQSPVSIEYRVTNQPIINGNQAETQWVESSFLLCKNTFRDMNNEHYEVIMITKDITTRKLAETTQHLIQEAKLMYINCIAHDLKTPLQSFSFAIDLLTATDLNDEQRDIASQALVSVDLMKLTISQAMHIGKVLGGSKVPPRISSVSVHEIVKKVQIIIAGYGSSAPVYFHVADNIASHIMTDEEWLWQNALNLITNACKYTPKGQIHVKVQIQSNTMSRSSMRSESNSHPMLLFQVVDSGVGLSESMLSKVFDPFNQAQVGQVVGSGLGLFGVRNRVERLGGQSAVYNNVNQDGCTFWFTIPYIADDHDMLKPFPSKTFSNNSLTDGLNSFIDGKVNDGVTTTQSNSSYDFNFNGSSEDIQALLIKEPLRKLSSKSMLKYNSIETMGIINEKSVQCSPLKVVYAPRTTGLTAYVIDDTVTICKLLRRTLLSMGFHEVECFENGAMGLEAMKMKQVDFVFTDVQMPIMTGPEVSIMTFPAILTVAVRSVVCEMG